MEEGGCHRLRSFNETLARCCRVVGGGEGEDKNKGEVVERGWEAGGATCGEVAKGQGRRGWRKSGARRMSARPVAA